MRFFEASLVQVVIRFYLMMACVLIGVFSGYYAIAFIALPFFLSAMLAIDFGSLAGRRKVTSAKVTKMPSETRKAA